MSDRNRVVALMESWIGKNKKQHIIDTYNTWYLNTKRKIAMQTNWPWCACTWSVIAIELGLTNVMPVEISCGELIKLAKEMGIWVENDGYIPAPGDGILYDWDDDGKGDNTSWPDHIGTVLYVNKASGYFVVGEGNYNNAIKKRTVSINGRYIRGFIAPKYVDEEVVRPAPVEPGKSVDEVAHEVIAGIWGSGDTRKSALEAAGYNYREIQNKVNSILNTPTAKPDQISGVVKSTCYAKNKSEELPGKYETKTDLYLRNDAGKNKKALCVMPKGTVVTCYGYYNTSGDTIWPYVSAIVDHVIYEGFCSSDYLQSLKAGD